MKNPKVVGHVVAAVSPVGTQQQEAFNAIHWAFYLEKLTIAQAVTACGGNYHDEFDCSFFDTTHRAWKLRVLGPGHE